LVYYYPDYYILAPEDNITCIYGETVEYMWLYYNYSKNLYGISLARNNMLYVLATPIAFAGHTACIPSYSRTGSVAG
jgi:hypothetical protein